MNINNIDDWLAFVDEVVQPAEAVLRAHGMPEDDTFALAAFPGSEATHLEHMAGSRDRDLTRTARNMVVLRHTIRERAKSIDDDPYGTAAQLGALAWKLHMLATALHAEALEGKLKHRPARQAKRREGRYGICRRVLEHAFPNGDVSVETARDWLNTNEIVELAGAETVNIRWCDGDDSFELSNADTDETKHLTDENMKTTLRRIAKTSKSATR